MTETKVDDEVVKAVIEELEKGQLIASAYYYEQQMARKLGFEEAAAMLTKDTLKCLPAGSPCSIFSERCCRSVCIPGPVGICS